MKRILAIAPIAMVLALCVGCATYLAPAYDQSISSELVTENSDIQALLVTIGAEVPASSFPAREAAYDHIIAELNATELQIKARPLPNPDALKKTQAVLARLNARFQNTADPNFSQYPSARSVQDLADTVTHMRDFDKAGGLRGGQLNFLKGEVNIYLTQAITYETFLKR